MRKAKQIVMGVLSACLIAGMPVWAQETEPMSEGDDVIEISTVEELAAINDNLSGHYVLTADIDLGGEEWTPIGTYAPSGDSEEEQKGSEKSSAPAFTPKRLPKPLARRMTSLLCL